MGLDDLFSGDPGPDDHRAKGKMCATSLEASEDASTNRQAQLPLCLPMDGEAPSGLPSEPPPLPWEETSGSLVDLMTHRVPRPNSSEEESASRPRTASELADGASMSPRYRDLFNAMKDPDPLRADEAFDAVLFDRNQAVPDLIRAYGFFADDLLLRYNAVQLLGFSGSPKAVRILIQALDDPAPTIRAEACRSLEDLKAKGAREVLRTRLGDVSPEVRQAAKEALARI